MPTIGPAIQGTFKDSPNTRIIHQVIESYGNLGVRHDRCRESFDSEDDRRRGELLESPIFNGKVLSSP